MNLRNLCYAWAVRKYIIEMHGHSPPKLFKDIQRIDKAVAESPNKWGCFGSEMLTDGCGDFCEKFQQCRELKGQAGEAIIIEEER